MINFDNYTDEQLEVFTGQVLQMALVAMLTDTDNNKNKILLDIQNELNERLSNTSCL